MNTSYEILFSILTGAAGGIAAGAFLTWCTSIQKKKRESLERKEQIDYILNLVMKYKPAILKLELFEGIPELQNRKSNDSIRHEIYQYFRKDIEASLSGRAKRLTFDEIEEIKKLFRIGPYQLIPNKGLSEYEYIEMFRKAESIEWLNIPPMA